jgi:dipeptidyl aminopeptidase/acylaminoacyl peptidase
MGLSWEDRYRAPAIPWSQLAKAAPTRDLVASNRSGIYQLYAWDAPSGRLRALTQRPTGVLVGVLSPDGRHVYYLDDQDDNEVGHFVRVPFEGGEPRDITPAMPPYSVLGLDVSMRGNRIALTLATAEGFHLYAIDAGPDEGDGDNLGTPRLLYRSPTIAVGPILSHGGEIAVIPTSERGGTLDLSLLAFDAGSGARLGELWDGEGASVSAHAFSPLPGDARVLATTNRGGVARPLLWDARTGERTELDMDGLRGEARPLDWSRDGRRILLGGIDGAVERLYIYDLARGTLMPVRHPDGTFRGAYFGPDGGAGAVMVTWQDSTHPARVIALSLDAGADENAGPRAVLAAGEVPPGHPWRSVSFVSSDGQTIQGWLGLPDGEGLFPTILETHGGPTSVQTNAFSVGSQAWLDRGYAYLTINYRGSTTFGRDFERKIWGDLGHWEVEDMVAARAWLVAQGIARPDHILLTGWSYGGYLTLLALSKRPELWAGGMAGIAIADWAVQYEDSADTLRGYQVALFGGTPAQRPEQYAASSPVTYADRVAAPVLIIQGRNDTRPPARPIEQYEAWLRSLGKRVEVHWFDAGHLGSFAQADLAIEHQAMMLRFAEEVIAGAAVG